MNEFVPPAASAPASFEQALLPHRDAAYNLARWLLRHEYDAEDCVQEAYLKAFQAFPRFRGTDGKTWLLTIVRNLCFSRLRQQQRKEPNVSFDEGIHGDSAPLEDGPWSHALAQELLPRALDLLPVEAREVLVLHELEGLAYREIASVAEIPLGTVMSRLARARQRLQQELSQLLKKELPHGM